MSIHYALLKGIGRNTCMCFWKQWKFFCCEIWIYHSLTFNHNSTKKGSCLSVKWLIVFWKSVYRIVLDLSTDKWYAARRFYSWFYNGNTFFQSVFVLPLLRFSLKRANISTQELQISLLYWIRQDKIKWLNRLLLKCRQLLTPDTAYAKGKIILHLFIINTKVDWYTAD